MFGGGILWCKARPPLTIQGNSGMHGLAVHLLHKRETHTEQRVSHTHQQHYFSLMWLWKQNFREMPDSKPTPHLITSSPAALLWNQPYSGQTSHFIQENHFTSQWRWQHLSCPAAHWSVRYDHILKGIYWGVPMSQCFYCKLCGPHYCQTSP